jgi:hypothetical protein
LLNQEAAAYEQFQGTRVEPEATDRLAPSHLNAATLL